MLAQRPTCARCLRPEPVCYCAHIPILPTRTRVLLLQHPREHRNAIGTARMAHLALPNSALRVAMDFADDPVVRDALAGSPPPYLLFPGPGAIGIADLPRDAAITLLVVDGTWWQAHKLLKLNPALAALPRVAFSPRQPSDYRIRRQPAEFCVSTIEALVEVLDALEPNAAPGTFGHLLDPFRVMVDRQIRYAAEKHAFRHLHTHKTPQASRVALLATRLAADWPHLVCVQGEANAWPARHPMRQDPEIVHWVASRPATGETYEAVVAPRRPLAPATSHHAALPEARLLAGVRPATWRQSWQDFLRPADVLVHWGVYYRNLAIIDGLPLPARSLDMRAEISLMLRRRVGTVEQCVAAAGATAKSLNLAGRGGQRLAALAGVVEHLARC